MLSISIGVVNAKVNPSGCPETPGRVLVAMGQPSGPPGHFLAPGWITTPMSISIKQPRCGCFMRPSKRDLVSVAR